MKINKKRANTTNDFVDYINQNSDFYDNQQALNGSIIIPEMAKDKYLLGNPENQVVLSKQASLRFDEETGEVKYISKSLITYVGTLTPDTDPYRLLRFFVNHSRKLYDFSTLVKEMEGWDHIDDQQKKVRSAASGIKKILKIKQGEEFIECLNKRFQIKRDVEIIK